MKFGFIHITTESLVRGLHVSLRTIAISFFGILIALTSQVVMIFYSLMQHLKVKSKVAYAFMAAIRMIPLMISSLIQLRRSLKMRYQMIDAANYRGLKRFKHLIIPLLSQNIRKAHQLSVAMESKGFRDGPRTYYYNVPFSYKDIIFIIVLIAIITLAYYCSITLPITGIDDVRLGRRLNFIHNCIDTKLEIHCIEKENHLFHTKQRGATNMLFCSSKHVVAPLLYYI